MGSEKVNGAIGQTSKDKELLVLSNVSLSISGLEILKDISLVVGEGETVGIIGPNGSGKTTLFNCLSGFHLASKGSLSFRGENITSLKPSDRARRGIGRVFQSPGIFREMTVLENMVTAIEGRYPLFRTFVPWANIHSSIKGEAMSLLREVTLESKALHKAASLSGGQLRLLEIVRALGFGAELLLLDEPTAGVSPKMKEQVSTLIERLRSMGKTIIAIEHDIEFIQLFCERIVVLDSGRVVMDGSPSEIRKSSQLQEIYFGGAREPRV